MMNKTIGAIKEYYDRYVVVNIFDCELRTIYLEDMTPAETRMMERLITRHESECFEAEEWVQVRSSGYFREYTRHILSTRRYTWWKREGVRGV